MRILQVNNFHYNRGGSDRYFLDLVTLLGKEGHDVATLATRHPRNTNTEWAATAFPPGISTADNASLRDIQNFLYSPAARAAMRSALTSFRPDVVHLHIYYGQLTASILEPVKEAGIPIVQTVHDYKPVCPTHALTAAGNYCEACQGRHYWRALQHRCNRDNLRRTTLSVVEAYISTLLGDKRHIDRFIVPSEFQREKLVRLGLPASKVSRVPHFVREYVDAPVAAGENFLYVGRLDSSKGVRLLLQAYARLPIKTPLLAIAGEGPDLEPSRQLAQELGVADRVKWLGHLSASELQRAYLDSRVVINPSLANETFGLTVLEAFAHSRPVIAANSGALPELMSGPKCGVVVDRGNVNQLQQAMLTYGSDTGLCTAQGHTAWEWALSNYSQDQHYSRVMAVYESLVAATHVA